MTSTTEVITAFLKNMAEQDNRSTAFPYYYVIRTSSYQYCHPNGAEAHEYSFEDTDHFDHDVIVTKCADYKYAFEEYKEADPEGELTLTDFRKATVSPVKKEWHEKKMFLTETDAKAHLMANSHHYSADAHTYVHHAWRAPELKNFFIALFKHFKVDRGNLDMPPFEGGEIDPTTKGLQDELVRIETALNFVCSTLASKDKSVGSGEEVKKIVLAHVDRLIGTT